jgi:hypothetical protein
MTWKDKFAKINIVVGIDELKQGDYVRFEKKDEPITYEGIVNEIKTYGNRYEIWCIFKNTGVELGTNNLDKGLFDFTLSWLEPENYKMTILKRGIDITKYIDENGERV